MKDSKEWFFIDKQTLRSLSKLYQRAKEQWKTIKAYISTKSEVLRDEQGLYKLKDDLYTNSATKEKVLGEYKRGGSEKQKGAVQYNKVIFPIIISR